MELPALRHFVEDELVRAPMWVDQVIEGALDHLRAGLPTMAPHERAMAGDLLQRVLGNRQSIVDYYMASLREQIGSGGEAAARRASPATLSLADSRFAALSLVDEDQVAIDVEISHTIEAIKSVADHELRELQTYVSALAGDMDVTRDHNPLRPEVHARALWAAAQAVPLARGYQIVFMRHASMALAQVLRKAFAGASSRLESAGVVPAAHRTVILPQGQRRRRIGVETTFSPDLERMREGLAPATARLPLEQLAGGAATPAERQALDLLGRLFDALAADAAIAPDVRALVAPLRMPAQRLALREPKALDQTGHALWQFVDRVAFYGETLPTTASPERDRVLRHLQALVDQLAAEPDQQTGLYQWALEHLRAFESERLAQRCAALSGEIAQLQRLEDKLVASQTTPSTMHGALDVAQLDTVPAELIDGDAPARHPAQADVQWLARLRPGDWVRMFMQGRWINAQLLWPGERGELFLFGHGASDTTWAVRRNAMLTLHAESLLDILEPRSLVRDAAKRVMRQSVR